ncbi:hypothetical protein Hanom_Chr13g01190301 [Helianthus anomalus]
MFVHLTKRTNFFVHVRSFIKRTNTNELPAERFVNCSLKVQFVCSPTFYCKFSENLSNHYTLKVKKKVSESS